MLFSGFFDLFGGGVPMREILLYLYVAESAHEDGMMATFNLLTAILIGTMSLGSFIGASLLDVNAFITCGLIVAAYVVLIPLVALFPSDDPAANRIDDTDDGSVEERSSLMPADALATSVPPSASSSPVAGLGSDLEAHEPPKGPAPTVLHALLRTVTVDLRYSIELVIQTVRHPFTRQVMLLYFGSTLAACISLVTPQWASGTFHTGLSNVAKVTAMEQIVSAVTLLTLPVLTKFVLYPRLRAREVVDFWVIVASLLATVVGTLVIATAPSLMIYAVGVAIAATGMGLSDALRSFATSALANKELVQMLYMSIRTVQTLAAIIGMPLWSAFFLWLLDHPDLPRGLLYLGNTCMVLVCFVFARSMWRSK